MASSIDFIVKNGLQVSTNLVVGTYTMNTAPTSNGAIISGNVGIGTASPTQRLHVVGNIQISNTATASGIRFSDGTFQSTAATAAAIPSGVNSASNVTITETGTASTFYLTFVENTTGNLGIRTDAGITYNPGTNGLSVGGIISSATWQGNAVNIAYGGTGLTSFANGDMVYATTDPDRFTKLGIGNAGNVLVSNGSNPTWGRVNLASTSAVTGLLPLANGGTNAALTAADGAMAYSTASALALTSPSALSWDNTNGRLGLGVSAPSQTLDVNGSVLFRSNLRILSTTDATGTTTGALVVQGGVGVAGNIFAGRISTANSGEFGNVGINNTTTSTSNTTGALTVAGGVGISGNIYTSGNIIQVSTGQSIFGNFFDRRGQVTVNLQTSTIFASNADITDTNRNLVIQNPSTDLVLTNPVYTAMSMQVAPTGTQGTGTRVLGDLKFYRTGNPYGRWVWTSVGGVTRDVAFWDQNNAYFLGNLSIGGANAASSTSTGGLVVQGGVGVGGNIFAGGSINGANVNVTGSAAPPNGMWLPGTNILGFSTGSSERMRLTPNGNLLLGGTFDNGFRLEVTNNNLGTAANSVIQGGRFNTSSGNADYLEILSVRSQAGGADWFTAGWRLQQKIDATWMGYMQFNGSSSNVGVGTTNNSGITFGAGSTTANPNGVPEVMRITSAGRVGIGTAVPSTPLHVMGNIRISNTTVTGGVVFADGTFQNTAFISTTAVRQAFTATASQTVFTVAGGYTPGQIDVYYNGVKLLNGTEVDVSNGTSVVLVTPATVGADVDVVAFRALNVLNAVSKSGDTMTGDLAINPGNLIVNVDDLVVNRLTGFVGINTPSPNQILDVNGAALFRSNAQILSTTQATSTATGAVITAGGVGVGGNLFVGGSINGANVNVTGASAPPNGIFLPAANQLGFAVNSTERIRVDAAGNFNMGTTAPPYPSGGIVAVTINAALPTVFLTSNNISRGYFTYDAVGGTSVTADTAGGPLNLGTSSANSIILYTNFVERMRINGNGNVGIGTTVPLGNLHVMGNIFVANSGAFIGGIRFSDGTFQSTASAGTAIPSGVNSASNITVTSTNTDATFFPAFVESTSGNIGIRVDTGLTYNPLTESLSLSGNVLVQNGGRFGNIAVSNTTQSTSTGTGAIINAGGAGIAGNLFVGGSINGANVNVTGTSAPPNGEFLPAANTLGFATGSTERMRITSGGVVAINTTSPDSQNRFQVSGNGARLVAQGADDTGQVLIEAQANSYWTGSTFIGTSITQFGANATGATIVGLARGSLGALTFQNVNNGLIYTNGGAPLVFGTTSLERMRITAAGRVGIGTAAPSSNLHVMGNITISNSAGVIGGVVFADGTYQNTAAAATAIPSGVNSASNVTVTSTSTDATFFPAFVEATTGNLGVRVDSLLTYNPNTEILSVIGGMLVQNFARMGNLSITNSTASTSTGTGALVVTGGVGIGANLTVGGASRFVGNVTIDGNLFVNGNLTTINTDQLSIEDPLIQLGTGPNGAPLPADDGLDRGVIMHQYRAIGGGDTHSYLGRENSSGHLLFITNVQPGVTNIANPVRVNSPGYNWGTANFGNLVLSGNANAIANSQGTGALIIEGQAGASIGGNLYVGSRMVVSDVATFAANIIASGNVLVSGGVRAGNLSITNATASASSTTGALIVTGGAGITGNAFVGNSIWAGNISITNATPSINSTSGALVVAGGVGIAGQLFVNSNIFGQRFTPTAGINSQPIMYLPATDTLGFATLGTERLRITTTGNVGIGTAAPLGNLHVMGNLWLSNNAAFIGGIRFPDGTFQTTAAAGTAIPSGVNSASNVTITDTSTASTFYLTFVESTTGNLGIRTDAGITYNPGTNGLSVSGIISSATWQGNAVNIAYGGTGLNTYANGDLLYATTDPDRFTKLGTTTGGAGSGNVLLNNGSTPTWGRITLSNQSSVTGTLALGNGGTNAALTAAAGAMAYSTASAIALTAPSALSWDNTNGRLGIGTSVPGQSLDVAGNVLIRNSAQVGNLAITNTTAATSTTTGALTVAGGAGIAGNVHANTYFGTANTALNSSNIVVTATATDAVFYPAFVEATSGNLGIRIDTGLTYNPGTDTMSIGGNILVQNGGRFGNIAIANTTQSTSTATGAVINAGGEGIAGNLFVGGSINGANVNVTGSAAPPNGEFLPAANTLGFATGSSERMRISSTGAVGIGTSSPASTAILDVAGNAVIRTSAQVGNLAITNATAATSTATGALTVAGGAGIAGNVWAGNAFITSNVGVGTSVMVSGYVVTINGGLAATTKSFVIDHPTRPGMKLRYGSLEGPENGVYVRGRIKHSNRIVLPEYWSKLVDPDTITVNVTPIGEPQDLYVESIGENEIVIGKKIGWFDLSSIDAYYTVFAERRDVAKLMVEV